MAKHKKSPVDRRNFLKGAAGSAAALMAASGEAQAQRQSEPSRSGTAPVLAKEADPAPSSSVEVLTADRPGSDFMLDVIKSIGFEYIASNPGSSFRALQESVVNYGGDPHPAVLPPSPQETYG